MALSWNFKKGLNFAKEKKIKKKFSLLGPRAERLIPTVGKQDIGNVILMCRWCPGVEKVLCTYCACFVWEDIPYPASRCRYVHVSVNGHSLLPSVSSLDEYHSKSSHLSLQRTFYFLRFSDKNILSNYLYIMSDII